ncbi:MAG TPA: mechanosensitive ion channel family protein [Verrucomicrobiae bacterium]
MKFRFVSFLQVLCLAGLINASATLAALAQPVVTNAPAADTTVNTNNLVNQTLARLSQDALTFGLEKIDFLKNHAFLGQPLWKYGASLIYILLAFLASWFIDFIINGWLKRIAARTETVYDDLILDLLRGPVKIVVFVILLNIGLGIFEWPAAVEKYLARGLVIVVAFSVTYLILNLVDLLLGVWREKVVQPQDKVFAEQLFPIFSKAAKVAIIGASILLTADNMGINIKTLLAGLSVGGLALGLAAQDTVANMFGAVAILLDKPFHIGDRVRVEGVDGIVESIGLRSTRVRSLEGHHVTIPNKLMGNAIITNISRRPMIKSELNFGLTYDTPTEKVRRATQVLEEIFRANPKTQDLIISFNRFADSALNIFVVHVWSGTDAKQHFADMQAFNLAIKERFEAERIEFAFPSQTVYVKSDAGK